MVDELEKLRHESLMDVQYQRSVLYNSPLYPPEIETINKCEYHIANKTGKTIIIRSARQTMKNECSGMLCARMMSLYREEGGIYIRTAPTHKPQIINSKMRVSKFLEKDPTIKGWYPKEGYMFVLGSAIVQFLSTDKHANVVGATASICLDIDEAHKVDKGKYEEDFGPMSAFHNVPTLMWGVAADKQDLLYEHLQYNLENNPDCILQYPAEVWCELRESYAKHYTERRNKLGADHPVILTQYDLVDVDVIGGYLKKHHLTSLFSGDHGQYDNPKDGKNYAVTIDIGGEDEIEELDPYEKSEGSRDSTVAGIWEVDWDNEVNGYPLCRLVNIYWWTGKGLESQQEILAKLLGLWQPHNVVVDARGVGEQIASYLNNIYGVNQYKASSISVSEDCYGTLAMLNNDCIKMWKNDNSREYNEFNRQAKHTSYEIKSHDLMRIVKPHGKGHIDMIKQMTYIYRAVMFGSGLVGVG
jgi:hypothetical protein